MPDPTPLLVIAVIALVIFLFRWMLWRVRRRRAMFVPSNDLEQLLLRELASPRCSDELRRQLSSATLLAIDSDGSGRPLDFSAKFPAGFPLLGSEPKPVTDGPVEFGPFVLCFSSRRIVQGIAQYPAMASLVTRLGKIREFPAREIFETGLDRKCAVVLNPFFGPCRRFDETECRELVATTSRAEGG